MNFLDTYDVAGSTTPTQEPEQSFNEEVSQVIGQLGRFWGGFRKQARNSAHLLTTLVSYRVPYLESDCP